MRGMDQLIRMRLAGDLPRSVAVDLDFHPHKSLADIFDGSHISIDSTEPLYSLDLRALQGLTVFVNGGAKAPSIARACAEAGAARVVAFVHQGADLVAITDTEGTLQWQKQSH